MGFYESMTFSFISAKSIAQLGLPEDDKRNQPLMVLNPLGEDTACMRTTLLCGLLKTLSTNIKNGNENGRLYEMGTIFDAHNRTKEGLPTETPALAIGMYGDADFYAIRGVVEALCQKAGMAYEIAACEEAYLHPGRRAAILVEGEVLAVLGEIHPDAAQRFDITGRAYVAQVNLPVFFAHSVPLGTVKSIARFPAVNRDLALVMKESQQVGPLMNAIKAGCGAMLEDIRMFDVFRGAQIGEGNKSVAFSLTYRAADHTLTDEEITRLTDKALKIAKEQFDAVLRA